MMCGDSKYFLFAVLLAGLCHSVESQTTSVWDGKVCPTGELQKVLIDLSTGEWKFFDEPTNDDSTRRMLGRNFDEHDAVHVLVDPSQFTPIGIRGDHFRRSLSPNGTDSLTASESTIGNVDDTTYFMSFARPCGCIDDDDSRFALCPDSSDWCKIDESGSFATCYSVGWIDSMFEIYGHCYGSGMVQYSLQCAAPFKGESSWIISKVQFYFISVALAITLKMVKREM